MATFRTSAAGGSSSGTSDRTVAITPAVGDLLVVYCFVSTNTNDSPTCSDNNAGASSWTRIDVANVVIAAVNHRLSVFVRNDLMVNTNATTITVATGSNTSGAVHCLAISGMNRTGTSGAVRSKGLQNNQAAGTAAPVLNQAALTANMTLVAQGSADTTTTPPTGWTEAQDTNFTATVIALETAWRNSGFTGTTITFGAASSTTFCSHALELDGTAPLAGVAALTFDSGSSTLTGAGALAGSAALALGASAQFISAIAGTAALAVGTSATIYHPRTQLGPFGYTQKRYGSFYRPPGRIWGQASPAFTATATANQQVFISGTAELTVAGKLLHPRWTTQLMPTMWLGRRYGSFFRQAESSITGTAAVVFGGSALIQGAAPISGSSSLLLDSTGTSAGTGRLLGVGSLILSATGQLVLPSGQVTGTASLVFDSGSSTLVGAGALATSTPLLFSGFASGVAAGHLSGTGSLTLAASGLLVLPGGQIVGTAALTISTTGTAYPISFLSGLYAYYRLDGNLLDSSGNARHLTGAGSEVYGPGVLGQELLFDHGERTAVGGGGNTLDTVSVSVAGWFKAKTGTTGAPQSSGQVGWSGPFDSPKFSFQTRSSNISRIVNFFIEEVASFQATGLADDQHYHAALVWDHTAGQYTFYLDGIVVASGPAVGSPALVSLDDYNIIIDADVINDSPKDECGLWIGHALNVGEVERLYNGGNGYYPLPTATNRVEFRGDVVTRRELTGRVCTRRLFEAV